MFKVTDMVYFILFVVLIHYMLNFASLIVVSGCLARTKDLFKHFICSHADAFDYLLYLYILHDRIQTQDKSSSRKKYLNGSSYSQT